MVLGLQLTFWMLLTCQLHWLPVIQKFIPCWLERIHHWRLSFNQSFYINFESKQDNLKDLLPELLFLQPGSLPLCLNSISYLMINIKGKFFCLKLSQWLWASTEISLRYNQGILLVPKQCLNQKAEISYFSEKMTIFPFLLNWRLPLQRQKPERLWISTKEQFLPPWGWL